MMRLTAWEQVTDAVADITYLVRWPDGIPADAWIVTVTEEWDIPDDGMPRRTVLVADAWHVEGANPTRYDARDPADVKDPP